MPSLLSSLLLLSFLLASPILVDARHNHVVETGENRIHYITDFGFLSGGTIDLTIEPRSSADEYELTLLICNEEDWWDAFDQYSNSEGKDLCEKIERYQTEPDRHPFCSVIYTFQTYGEVDAIIESGDWYYFDLVNCADPVPEIDVEIEYTFYNPGGEHLPYDVIPLPGIYSVLILLYGLLFFCWILNWAFNIGGSNKLHKLLFLPLMAKILVAVYSSLFWAGFSVGGNATAGLVFGFFYILFLMIYELFWNGCLFLVSLGWGVVPIKKDDKWCLCITIGNKLVLPITVIDMCIIPLILFALFLALAAPFPLRNSYYLLLACLVYVVSIVYTFVNTIRAERQIRSLHPSLKRPFGLHLFGKTYSLNSLMGSERPKTPRDEAELTGDEKEDVENYKRKIRLLSNYKYIFIFYYIALMIIIFVTVIFWTNFFWLFVAFYEAVQFVMFMALLIQFRVRSGKGEQSPYFSNSAYDRFYDEASEYSETPRGGDTNGAAATGTFYDDDGSTADSAGDDQYQKYYDEEEDESTFAPESELEKTV